MFAVSQREGGQHSAANTMVNQRTVRLHLLVHFALSLLVYSTAEVTETKISYDGYSVWKAKPNDENGLKYLHNLFVNGSDSLKLDFWHPPSRINQTVDIMVDLQSLLKFKEECKSRNISLNSFIENVQKLIEQEKRPVASNLRRKQFRDSRSFDFSQYPTLDAIENYIKGLQTQYPNLISTQELATTHEKRPVYLVTITNKSTASSSKPAIWIDGGIHAREWIAPITTIYLMNRLLTNYGKDPNITKYLDKLTWYFMPVMNPDGYAFTKSKDRMWRKNRRPKTCPPGSSSRFRCCEGVDLNRNFGYHWAESGSSNDPCSEVYQGPSAFSEPESQGVRNFVLAHKNIRAYLTLHSYSLMWIYPYGYKPNTYSSDKNDLVNLAVKATNALTKEYGTVYTIGSAPDILYSAAGGSDDWVKGVAGVKYVYTLELRPADYGTNNGFILPTSEIMPTGEETWAAVRVIADEILAKYSNDETENSRTENESTSEATTTTLEPSNFCTDDSNWCKYWSLFGRCNSQDVVIQCKKACNLC